MTLAPSASLAQQPAKPSDSKKNPAPETRAPATVSQGKVAEIKNGILVFDPLTIEGRVQRPQAIYTSERSAPAFGALVPADSFLDEIVKAVEKEPF